VKASRISPARLRVLNSRDFAAGEYVLYWMQQAQRAEWNDALEYAIELGNELGVPVVAGFGLMDDYPEANLRHYVFMLEGLREVAGALAKRGVGFVLQHGEPARVALKLARHARAVICDRGYLRHQKAWRRTVAEEATCRVVQVETEVVVPVETASSKAEFAARTIRPRLHRHLAEFLVAPKATPVHHRADRLELPGSLDLADPEALAQTLRLNRSIGAVTRFFEGGSSRAKAVFRRFLTRHLAGYVENSNQPQTDDISHMSPYLHFGQVSPVWLALEAEKHRSEARDDVASYVEELIVRRELAMNFVHFRENYDRYECLPEWARLTLANHRADRRPHLYNLPQLEAAETHDPYWNAAMREMRHTGFMHNYMRMYWGKKILEWSREPEAAYAATLELNNRWFLDGRDPNSFGNVAWIFGQHDRPWGERPIFGKVRYMNARGLERKCDIRAYVQKVDRLVAVAG
jgi:deoxyribodipyrimidine photo-lyase